MGYITEENKLLKSLVWFFIADDRLIMTYLFYTLNKIQLIKNIAINLTECIIISYHKPMKKRIL
jgi:hypothetical protein